jgi:hypothetical protein
LTKYAAIDLPTLVSGGLLNKLPEGVDKVSSTGVGTLKVPNFLWLFKKQSSAVGTDDDRAIAVFILIRAEPIEPPPGTTGGGPSHANLKYQQILGP